MSVTNTDTVSTLFTGNGVTDAFSTTFHFSANSEVKVYLVLISTGVETLQTITTHYTVTGAGTGAAGTVTFVTPPSSLYKVKMKRETARTQTTDYVEATKFPASTHETALDKLTRISQEIDAKIDRSPQLPISSENYPLVFPDFSSDEGGYLFRVNTDGDELELVSPTDAALSTTLTPTDNYFIVGNGTDWTAEQPSDARSSLGLGTIATQAASAVAITGGAVTGITDITVADGGTGASSASDARTNLGLAIGTNVQAYSAALDTLAAATITAAALTVLDDASVSAMVDTLGGAAAEGTGAIVRKTGATLVTPTLGVATATSINGATITSGTLNGSVTGTNTGDQSLFSTIAVSGQSDVVADTTTDTLTFVAGSNMTITTTAGSDTITFASSGGGAGAPTTSQYVTLATDGSLSNERVLTGTANQIVITDAGAGSTVTLSTPQNLHTSATPTFASATLTSSATIGGNSTLGGFINMLEDTDNGAHKVVLAAPNSLAGDTRFQLPGTNGSNTNVLITDGSGNTSWAASSSGTAASQAEQETGTEAAKYVAPLTQQFHPSACKCWIKFTSVTTTAITTSYNVTSVTDNGTGDTTITIATDFSSANYSVGGIAEVDGSNVVDGIRITAGGQAAGTLRVRTHDWNSSAPLDAIQHLQMFGDQ
jgi:hypothetical protein